MKCHRVQISLQDDSLLARDRYVNTIYLASQIGASTTPIDFDATSAAITNFYYAIRSYLSPNIGNNLNTIKFYDLDNPLESPPVYTGAISVNGGFGAGAQAIPNEVACCLTFHGFQQPGVRPQSWRGRIYIGPLSSATLAQVDSESRPLLAFRQAMVTAAVQMDNAFFSDGECAWVIASKTQSALYVVRNVYVDDAWDTQRSRGDRPSGNVGAPLVGDGSAFQTGLPFTFPS